MSEKYAIISDILRKEGYGTYTDDLSDSGGKTKWGITEKTAKSYGYNGDMRDLEEEIARLIYEKSYLVPIKFDLLIKKSKKLAIKMADIAVNCGVNFAGKALQKSINLLNYNELYYPNVEVDGIIGNKSLYALQEYFTVRGVEGENVLAKIINNIQGARYINLAEKRTKDAKYIYGWFAHRID